MDEENQNPNVPRIDLEAALDVSLLKPWVEWQYADYTERVETMAASYRRFTAAVAGGIKDEETAGKATNFSKILAEISDGIDAARTRIKKPVLHAARLIDGDAKALIDQLVQMKAGVDGALRQYLAHIEREKRAAAEFEAQRLAREAEAALQEAQATASIEAADIAVDLATRAEEAAVLAEEPPQDLTRLRTQSGAMAALRDKWVYRVTDISKVHTHYLVLNESAIKAAVRGGAREIPGLEIYNEGKVAVR